MLAVSVFVPPYTWVFQLIPISSPVRAVFQKRNSSREPDNLSQPGTAGVSGMSNFGEFGLYSAPIVALSASDTDATGPELGCVEDASCAHLPSTYKVAT